MEGDVVLTEFVGEKEIMLNLLNFLDLEKLRLCEKKVMKVYIFLKVICIYFS